MAQPKKVLLEEAQALGLEVSSKNTIAELTEMIADAARQTDEVSVAEVASDAEIVDQQTEPEEKFAKAGKRSHKAVDAASAEELRQERKISQEAEDDKPKAPVTPTRSRLERRGKRYRKSAEQIEAGKLYDLKTAVELAKKTSHVKFDATVELHINLGVDPRHADQNIRDNLVLPAGTGKSVRIAVLSDDPAAAKKSGADIAGADELFAALDKGVMDFDILIATPNLMPKLGKYARSLGPRGLMPNPKSGTVTTDVDRAVAEAKAGRVEYRVDTNGIVHLGVGKVSFTPAQLGDNVSAVLASIKANKPQSVKGNYFKAIHITTSMGPSISVDLASIG